MLLPRWFFIALFSFFITMNVNATASMCLDLFNDPIVLSPTMLQRMGIALSKARQLLSGSNFPSVKNFETLEKGYARNTNQKWALRAITEILPDIRNVEQLGPLSMILKGQIRQIEVQKFATTDQHSVTVINVVYANGLHSTIYAAQTSGSFISFDYLTPRSIEHSLLLRYITKNQGGKFQLANLSVTRMIHEPSLETSGFGDRPRFTLIESFTVTP